VEIGFFAPIGFISGIFYADNTIFYPSRQINVGLSSDFRQSWQPGDDTLRISKLCGSRTPLREVASQI